MMASELNAGSRTSGIQANRNDLADENVGLEGKVNRLPRIASSGFLLSDSGSPIPNSPNPTRWGLLSPMSDAHTDGDSTSTSRTASCVSGSSASPFAPVTKEILESRITNEIKEMRAAGLSSVDFETNAGNISNLLRSLLLYNEKYEANSKTEEMKEVIEEMKEGKKLFFAAKALLSNKSATVDQLDECALELKTYLRREKFLSLADKKLLRGERNKCVDLAVKVRFESMLLGVEKSIENVESRRYNKDRNSMDVYRDLAEFSIIRDGLVDIESAISNVLLVAVRRPLQDLSDNLFARLKGRELLPLARINAGNSKWSGEFNSDVFNAERAFKLLTLIGALEKGLRAIDAEPQEVADSSLQELKLKFCNRFRTLIWESTSSRGGLVNYNDNPYSINLDNWQIRSTFKYYLSSELKKCVKVCSRRDEIEKCQASMEEIEVKYQDIGERAAKRVLLSKDVRGFLSDGPCLLEDFHEVLEIENEKTPHEDYKRLLKVGQDLLAIRDGEIYQLANPIESVRLMPDYLVHLATFYLNGYKEDVAESLRQESR